MKTTSFKRIVFFSLMAVLAASCGGGGGGGSSSNNYGNMNPITGGTSNENIDQQAVPLYNSILNWRNQINNNPRLEKGFYGQGIAFSKGMFVVNQQPELPEGCKEYAGGLLVLCKGGQQSTITPTSIVERKCIAKTLNTDGSYSVRYKSVLNGTGTLIQDCMNVTSGDTAYRIGNNTELNDILSFRKGKIYRIDQVRLGEYLVFIGPRNNGYYGQATHAYIINTNFHSIYSPTANQALNSQNYVDLYERY